MKTKKTLYSNISDEELICEIEYRINGNLNKTELLKNLASILKDNDYIAVYPKYIILKSMLEDYIRKNNMDN